MVINLFKLIIHITLLIYISNYISIPLKIYENNYLEKILLDSNELEEDNLKVILYDEISVGDPKQKIIFIISPKEYHFYMVLDNNKEIKEISYYYDIKKSNTTNLYFGENEVGARANTYFMKEKFYFNFENITNKKSEEIGVNGIDIVVYLKRPQILKDLNLSSNVNTYMVFGLRLCESIDRI